ncbi:hypothetical protein BDW59DRAFT_163629 [Aspergillus cavernicola]|uniref:Uncharacterized protein n=1 Tax=Aspergillus cavernicola TaxID=176166 RepID=A0ABR4I4X9_9EURO
MPAPTESNSDLEVDSEDSGDGDDLDHLDDEDQLPAEHYLAKAANLDASQLRQKRYSNGTQERLYETHMSWNRWFLAGIVNISVLTSWPGI